MRPVRPKVNFVSIFVLNLISKKMKKIYFLLSCLLTISSFGQVFTEDFNYADNALLTANGWTAHSGTTAQIDVGTSNGLNYTGYSGTTGFTASAIGNAARLDNTGEDVNKAFSTPITSGDLYISFLVNVTTAVDGYFLSLGTGTTTFFARFYAKPSTTSGKINFGIGNSAASYSSTDFEPNTTYLAVIKYGVSATGPVSLWIIPASIPVTEAAAGVPTATATGSGGASVAGVYLRQYNASQNITIDGLRVYPTWFNTSACPLSLGTEVTVCNGTTSAIDTYNVTIPFTGGNSGSYTLSTSSGTISGANPSSVATGDIIVSGVSEGTNITLTIGGACAFNKVVTAPECKVINPLPVNEPFNYTAGTTLNTSQMWTNVSTGSDEITTISGNLSYTGIASTGNSVSFAGTGSDTKIPFTETTSGNLYTSFLVSVTNLTGVSITGTTYFATLSNAANTFTTARIYFKTDGTQFQYGVSPSTLATDIVWSPNLYSIGSTQYLVIGYDFTSNLMSLYENPSIGGSASSTVSITPAAAFTSLANFVLRQDSATSTPAMTIDELKITTTPNFTLANQSFSQIDGLKMYPNPAKNNLFIETALNSDINVSIINVLGKEVINSKVSNNAVNISGLTPGMYIVKITEEGKTSTKKLIIE